MFIVTAKIRKGRLALGILGLAAVCVAAAAVTGWIGSRTTAASAPVPDPKGVRTAEDRVAYLEGYGWQVDPTPLAVEELLIPEEFDETYEQYLALQTQQGFDLNKYRGKRVKRYAYEVKNYPTGESGVQVGLLIYKNRVIGGEVLSSGLNGFLHGLSMPETPAPNV